VDDSLATQAVLLLFGGALLGGCVGAAAAFISRRRHRRDSFMPGLAIGLLVFGICTAVGALRLGWAAWQFEHGTLAVAGSFVRYEEKLDTNARGRRTRTLAPRVAYEAADGQRYTVLGLGGSQDDRVEGDVVPVRYRADAPQQAVVDDFQNRWGAFWAFSGFAGFGLLAGAFFAVTAWGEGRPRVARPRQLGPRARALSRMLTAAAGLTLVASIVLPTAVLSDQLERGLAMTFAGVAAAMLLYAGALLLAPPPERSQSLLILLILTAGFGFFAFGLWRVA
jgi:hypothetical protein